MNEGGIRPAVVSICMNLFICSKPTALSATAGVEQAALLTPVKGCRMGRWAGQYVFHNTAFHLRNNVFRYYFYKQVLY